MNPGKKSNEKAHMPLISVVVPVYNVKKYLSSCVNSLLTQEFQDYEIILVDDGSTDGSSEICDEYETRFHNIHVLHKENGGLVSARKAGAMMATGEYIAAVDGDDGVTSIFFEKLAEIIALYEPDIIQFDSVEQRDEKIIECRSKLQGGLYQTDDIKDKLYCFLIENKEGRYFPPSVNYMLMKRALYLKCQLSVDDRIKIGEDCACTKPAVFFAQSLYVLHECLGFYRRNPDSMTCGRKVYDLLGPKYIGLHLEKMIDMDCCDFQEQLYRNVTHNLFIACCSQFYSNSSYRVIVDRIKQTLHDSYYSHSLQRCRYSRSYIKGNLAVCALKAQLCFLLYLYSRWFYK